MHGAVIFYDNSAFFWNISWKTCLRSSWGSVFMDSFRIMSMVVCLLCSFLFHHRFACKQIIHQEWKVKGLVHYTIVTAFYAEWDEKLLKATEQVSDLISIMFYYDLACILRIDGRWGQMWEEAKYLNIKMRHDVGLDWVGNNSRENCLHIFLKVELLRNERYTQEIED